MIEWAFKAYASGNWTVSQIHDELTSRGLVSLPTPKRPSKPLAVSSVHRMLTNPYYKGCVRYQGVTFAGAHEALVPNEVWDQVQTVLGTHRSAADATQVHEHYLKGTVFCGQCGSRLIVCNAKSSQGTIYPYFVCGSRHGGRGDCTRQAMLIEHVERLVEQCGRPYSERVVPADNLLAFVAAAWTMYLQPADLTGQLALPVFKDVLINLSWFFIPFAMIVIVVRGIVALIIIVVVRTAWRVGRDVARACPEIIDKRVVGSVGPDLAADDRQSPFRFAAVLIKHSIRFDLQAVGRLTRTPAETV